MLCKAVCYKMCLKCACVTRAEAEVFEKPIHVASPLHVPVWMVVTDLELDLLRVNPSLGGNRGSFD